MRILLTGAAGFIGSHTALTLQKAGHVVLGVDNLATGNMENLNRFRETFHLCDICDMKILEQAFEEFHPEVVIHLAAQAAITTAFENPQRDLSVNGIGTVNLVMLSRKYNAQRFVFSSTSAVYDENMPIFKRRLYENSPIEPNTPYGISKLAAEKYIRMFFPNHVILRYGNVYGPHQQPIGQNQVIARALRHFMLGDEFQVFGNGEQKRDFVFVNDVANANLIAASSGYSGTFNIASGKSYSVNRVLREIETICDVVGYRWEHAGENDPRRKVEMDISSARRYLHWEAATPLSRGLLSTVDWWKEQVS